MNSISWQQLEHFIQQNNLADKPLWIALSGGVDSVCLLHLAKELSVHTGLNVNAIHVNHGLSDNADSWQHTVSQLCEEWGVSLVCKTVNIQRKPRTSLEQLARDARYQAIASEMPSGSVLLTGHHQADQFETFILRLMRGSGGTGLGAMKAVADVPNPLAKQKQLRIARPMLAIAKEQVLEYAKAHNLTWVEDESNQDERFDRNFVRAKLLPLFLERWPSATKSVETSALLLEQEADLLQEYLEHDLKHMLEHGFANLTCLNLVLLKQQKRIKQASLVRLFLKQQVGFYPSKSAIEELLTNLLHSRKDSQPELRLNKCFTINVYNEQLYVTKSLPPLSGELRVKANKKTQLLNHRLYSSLTLSSDSYEFFDVKFGVLSDKLVPNSGSGSKKVKELLKSHKCPPWYRSDIPLIYVGDKLVAVGNVSMDKDFIHQVKVELN